MSGTLCDKMHRTDVNYRLACRDDSRLSPWTLTIITSVCRGRQGGFRRGSWDLRMDGSKDIRMLHHGGGRGYGERGLAPETPEAAGVGHALKGLFPFRPLEGA